MKESLLVLEYDFRELMEAAVLAHEIAAKISNWMYPDGSTIKSLECWLPSRAHKFMSGAMDFSSVSFAVKEGSVTFYAYNDHRERVYPVLVESMPILISTIRACLSGKGTTAEVPLKQYVSPVSKRK